MARKWLMEVWLIEHAPKYFKRKKDEKALQICAALAKKVKGLIQ
jgi:hypothetical protein